MTDVSPVAAQVAKTPPPLVMVIFGASGDLTARKVLPALAAPDDFDILPLALRSSL